MFQLTVVCLIRSFDLAICDCSGSTCCGEDDAKDVIEIEVKSEPIEEKPEKQKTTDTCHCQSFEIPSRKKPKNEEFKGFKGFKPFDSKPSTTQTNPIFGGPSLKTSTL